MDDSGKRQTHAEQIYQALLAGPANYEAIAMRCGLQPIQVDRRLNEVPGIRKTDRTTKTKSGVSATVWEITPTPKDDCKQAELFAA